VSKNERKGAVNECEVFVWGKVSVSHVWKLVERSAFVVSSLLLFLYGLPNSKRPFIHLCSAVQHE